MILEREAGRALGRKAERGMRRGKGRQKRGGEIARSSSRAERKRAQFAWKRAFSLPPPLSNLLRLIVEYSLDSRFILVSSDVEVPIVLTDGGEGGRLKRLDFLLPSSCPSRPPRGNATERNACRDRRSESWPGPIKTFARRFN